MDYTDFKEEGSADDKKKAAEPLASQHHRWWLLPVGKDDASPVANAISETLNILDRAQAGYIAQIVRSTRLYGNMAMSGLNGIIFGGNAAAGLSTGPSRERLTYNVVQSCIDTATAMIAANQPKPYVLTNGGDFHEQRKAKKHNDLIDGVFAECDVKEKGPLAFRDGGVWGDGWLHVFEKDERVAIERVPCTELYVDEMEALFGLPRQMHRVRNVDRMVLCDAFPSKRQLIMDAMASKIDNGRTPNVADVVTVRESWHLPSGKDATDGKHIITINGVALTDLESWPHPWFPFARFRWCPRMYGFRSQGAAEQLQPMQIEINKILFTLQRSYEMAGSFKIFIENTSKIVKSHLNNDVGTLLTYTGTPPQYVTPPIVPPEMYQHLQMLIKSAYALVGISEMSAASEKPAGLDSGKALREFYDIGSSRMEWIGKEYERFHVDLADKVICTAREIAKQNGGTYRVRVPGDRSVRDLEWSAKDLEQDGYRIQCFPVSALPDDPAGRLQTITEYTQAGMFDQDTGRELLDFPDIKAVENMWDAPREYVSQLLSKIVDEGDYNPPEPFDDLSYALKRALQFYAKGKTQGLEPERLEMLRRFIQQTQSLLAPPAPAMAPQMPPSGQPQAVPEAPPTSPLLPNAPGATANA